MGGVVGGGRVPPIAEVAMGAGVVEASFLEPVVQMTFVLTGEVEEEVQIGRASCRERV